MSRATPLELRHDGAASDPGRRAVAEPCAMASLIEARRDGRLGEREAASLGRHLGVCTACRDLERDLDEVRGLLRLPSGPPLTALEHQRNRLALLRAAAAPPPSRRRPSRAARSAAAIALTALAAAAALALFRQPAPAVMVAQHLPAIAQHAPRGPYPAETTLRGSAEARFEQRVAYDDDRGKLERVALAEGTLDLAVRKLGPGERFVVTTDDAEVEVRGTVFAVEAHAGRIARVTVSEGKVEVRHRRATSLIAAGGSWSPPVEEAAIEPVRDEAPSERRRAQITAVTTAPTLPASLGAPLVGGPSPRSPNRLPLEGSGNASKAFGDAVDLLGRGDYAAARAQLEAFRAAHPADGRADLAAFLTIVSLQHAGRRAEAQEAARRYLELYPTGDRRADAARVASGR